MAVYGISLYGTDTYGLSLPPAYLVDPFTAVSNSYNSIFLTWKQPSGIMFRYRLVANRYGFPVNENDGNILIDQADYPGSSYVDYDVIPGTYHYYGFYVLADVSNNIWIRSGFASCLAVEDLGMSDWILSLLPEYFKTDPETGDSLTDSAYNNTYLEQFINVLAWGANYLQTQYQTYADHLNDPSFIPLDDLWNLAQEVGLDFNPDTPAPVVRKAVSNQAHVSQLRGTTGGIREEIQIRTGWDADIQIGKNILLINDQSQFLSPIFMPYDPNREYQLRECVWVPSAGWQAPQWEAPLSGLDIWTPANSASYFNFWNGDGYWYQCINAGTYGVAPPNDGTANANWEPVRDADDFLSTLINVATGAPSSWELLDSSAANGIPVPGSLTQGLGVSVPTQTIGSYNAWNSLRFYNKNAANTTFWCRSVPRSHTTLGQIPDSSFEIGSTIPGGPPSNVQWVPGDWPKLYFTYGSDSDTNDGDADSDDFLVPAFWTPQNCLITRTQAETHSGSWSAQITSAIPGSIVPELNDPSFESSTAEWTGLNCSIVQSETMAHTGSASMALEPYGTTGTAPPYAESVKMPCTAGAGYTVSAYADAAATTTMVLGIRWYNGLGWEIASVSTATSIASGSWTQFSVSGTAPADAESMDIVIAYQTLPASTDIVYIDDVYVSNNSIAPVSIISPWISCPAGTSVNAQAFVYPTVVLSHQIQCNILWYTYHGQLIGTSIGTLTTPTENAWNTLSASGSAPAEAVYAALEITMPQATSADKFLMDDTTLTAALVLDNNWPPENINAIQYGVPVPWLRESQNWNASTTYGTNDLVLYNGQAFRALRASVGVPPPINSVATAEWEPVSQSDRIRLMVSAYTSQNLTSANNYAVACVPFVEWFDEQGNWLARVFARNPNTNGAEAKPDGLTFDSFNRQSLTNLSASSSLIALSNWTADFYNTTDLSGNVIYSTVIPSLNTAWDNVSPGPDVNASQWSAIFTTSFIAPVTGTYTFPVQGTGAYRLLVNGLTVLNNWSNPSVSTLTADVSLIAGQNVSVEIQYADINSGWTSPTSPNLLPRFSSYAPYTTSTFAVSSGAPYVLSIYSTSGWATITIGWFDHNGTLLGTTSEYVLIPYPADSYSLSGNIYSGASFASVTVTPGPKQVQPPTVRGGSFEQGDPTGPLDNLSATEVNAPASGSGPTVTTKLAGRYTDDSQSNWDVTSGTFTVGGYQGGAAWPDNPAALSRALINGSVADGKVSVTLRSDTGSTLHQALIFRYSDANNYWRCTRYVLEKMVGGTVSTVATHSTSFSDNDRMTVELNGDSIIVYRNNQEVSSTTDSFNSTATSHGIGVE